MSLRARRQGHSLLELMVVIAIMGVIGTMVATTLTGTHRLARLHSERVAAREAVRTASAILSAELRYLAPATDLYAWAPDSVAVRALRGRATICEVSDDAVIVRYRGLRSPEPAKDSVLVMGPTLRGGPGEAPNDGGVVAYPLLYSRATSSGCMAGPDESLFRWQVGFSPVRGSVLLLFEKGSYHLVDGALRYRRGEAGRQPLTAELFDDRAAAMHWLASSGGTTNNGNAGPDPSGQDGIATTPGGLALELSTRTTPISPVHPLLSARLWVGLPNSGTP